MRFVIDLDSLEVIESANDRRKVTQVEGKRGDDSPFEVVFVRSGIAEELAASSVLTFGAKQEGKYDAAAVVLENGFTLSGTGPTAVYSGNPSFNTAALNALFLIDADDTNDPTYIDLMAEFTWQVGAGAPTSTKTFRFRVHNDVVRDDEFSPTPGYAPIGDTAPVNLADQWTARDSVRTWRKIASSATGEVVYAVVTGTGILVSIDAGATWTVRETARSWSQIACSRDGTKAVAAVSSGQIYTTTDRGLNWTPRESNRLWSDIAADATATKLVACVSNNYIYTSTDSGATWTQRESVRIWSGVASSADGSTLYATCSTLSDRIYKSTDSGATWTPIGPTGAWQSVSCSEDGTRVLALDNTFTTGRIYTSVDSGANWTARDSYRDWRFCSMSGDGLFMAAAAENGQIYFSLNAGVSWTAKESNRSWRGINISNDGNKAFAAANAAQIYTSFRTSTPPYIRVADGFLYIQEAGVWKKTALSAL